MAKFQVVATDKQRLIRKRSLSVPFINLTDKPHMFVKVLGAMMNRYVQGFVWSRDGTLPLVPVTDLDTNTTALLIVPATLAQAFMTMDGPYIGRSFELRFGPKWPGKCFGELEIYELEDASPVKA